MSDWRHWLPDLGVGLMVLLLGLLEVLAVDPSFYRTDPRPGLALVMVGIAAACALCRLLPAAALVIVWAVCLMQVLTGTQVLMSELAIGIVAFGVARWGRAPTVWASALSIPVAALVASRWLSPSMFDSALNTAGFESLIGQIARFGRRGQLAASLLAMAVIGAPWLAGLALRFSARAQQSQESQVAAEAERDQAEEIARLRENQAQLARDVHDVVGHSLAVILAQAESAQYLPDDDPAALQRTMQNIAASARSSLEDVRQVLAATSGRAVPHARLPELDSLVEGVRAGGQEVITTEVGTPRPLPPELEVVALRVVQEMLTNAVKHGRRDLPVRVERHWAGELRIEVQNAITLEDASSIDTRPLATSGSTHGTPSSSGHGIDGMRRRLEAVGGRLDVRRRAEPPTFTATAWVPVRTL